ncbi:hypothetical protein TsFJ059_005157 [Trichoderma semiorbis]|uniref:Uncharacterized protein n=1 Tax=Trichoderma semiorbis TaxID=1491008 RepID=A0A9P8HV79_9HYPO|nr:hypothetical protein TsFJ059_005157 [Trichoderma semiorbis]
MKYPIRSRRPGYHKCYVMLLSESVNRQDSNMAKPPCENPPMPHMNPMNGLVRKDACPRDEAALVLPMFRLVDSEVRIFAG